MIYLGTAKAQSQGTADDNDFRPVNLTDCNFASKLVMSEIEVNVYIDIPDNLEAEQLDPSLYEDL